MPPRPELALALLRLVLGLTFAAHGYHAIFGSGPGSGLGSLAAQYRAWGVPLPLLLAPLVATLQLAGGLLLALGLGTRPIAAALALVTAGAVCFAQHKPSFLGTGGLELPLLLLCGALALALGGGGALAFEPSEGGAQEAVGRGKRRKAEG